MTGQAQARDTDRLTAKLNRIAAWWHGQNDDQPLLMYVVAHSPAELETLLANLSPHGLLIACGFSLPDVSPA